MKNKKIACVVKGKSTWGEAKTGRGQFAPVDLVHRKPKKVRRKENQEKTIDVLVEGACAKKAKPNNRNKTNTRW